VQIAYNADMIAGLTVLCLLLFLFLFCCHLKYNKLNLKHKKLLSQKKQSEVILGQITEQLVPFLDQFPYNPKQCQFLGQPIDYIIFEDEKVIFVEVKSGNSRLSKKQRLIKSNIEEGKVEFKEIRIK
jgi:predicted Holliday junction resolvase-like endonuclease